MVVTDNDGDVGKINKKYEDYQDVSTIKICFDEDIDCRSLEHQLLKANSLAVLNNILGKSFVSKEELIKYMTDNKTDCALKVFNSDINIDNTSLYRCSNHKIKSLLPPRDPVKPLKLLVMLLIIHLVNF